MKKNRLRELLNEGQATFGTRVITPWPGIIEVIGHSEAFDYIEYVGENSPFSLEALDNIGRTIELFPNMSAMIKVEEQTRGFIATRAIGAGISNVLFTDCRSVDDVRECIQLVRAETPISGGSHGSNNRRNVGYVIESGSEVWTRAMDDVVIAIMIEKKGAVENLEEILSIEGYDMIQFGPNDYSISIGKPGQAKTADVQQTEQHVIEQALKKGKVPRVELDSIEQAKPYIDMGVRNFCIGIDLRIIYQWCQSQAKVIQELRNSI